MTQSLTQVQIGGKNYYAVK